MRYLASLASAAFLFLAVEPAHAQNSVYVRQTGQFGPLQQGQRGPFTKPSFGTYLNLTGSNPAVGYYGQVRPQLDARQFEAQQRATNTSVERRLDERELSSSSDRESRDWTGVELPPTGHRTTFMNFSSYFGR